MSDKSGLDSSRIAIKFGSSASKGSSKPARPPLQSSLGKRPRSHALNPDSESENEDMSHGRHEAVTHFGANGVENAGASSDRKRSRQGPLVIQSLPDKDWRGEVTERNREKNLLPSRARVSQDRGASETQLDNGNKPIKWGLNLKGKARSDNKQESQSPADQDRQIPPAKENDEPKAPKTTEQEALDALTGSGNDNSDDRGFLIPRTANDGELGHVTEEDAYQRDMRSVGNDNTLDDYDQMPVEEFGAALLRGMGWDGKARAPARKDIKSRQNLLGLGAKQLKEAEELGAWNQKGRKDSRRPRLHEYRRQDEERKTRRDERHRDSYKNERDRERENGRTDASRHRSRDYRR